MRGKKTNQVFGILLAMTLLFQLAYHTFHVLTTHISGSHIEHTKDNAHIDEASYSCDLCAKLLGNAAYVLLFSISLLCLIVYVLDFGLRAQFYLPKIQRENPLRGPPYLTLSI